MGCTRPSSGSFSTGVNETHEADLGKPVNPSRTEVYNNLQNVPGSPVKIREISSVKYYTKTAFGHHPLGN